MEKIKRLRDWVHPLAFRRAAENWKGSKYVPSRVNYVVSGEELYHRLYLVQRTLAITPAAFKEHKHE